VDMKLEVVLPVADVERAKDFYGQLGRRLDTDFGTKVASAGRGADVSGVFDAGMPGALFQPGRTGRAGTELPA
jgi:catechol 2,3-dioxygenase-like lactoylglutathione lyase family enzyme